MSKCRGELKPAAVRALKKLDRPVQRRVVNAAEGLAENPPPSACEKLTGATDLFRIPVGNYQILYQVQDDVLSVLVVKVGHRGDVHRR